MLLPILIVAAVVLLAVTLWLKGIGIGDGGSKFLKGIGGLVGVCVVAAVVGFLFLNGNPEPAIAEADVLNRPIVEHSDGYVGSDACRECHPGEHSSWHASYHRTMTQLASPTSVFGTPVSLRSADEQRFEFRKTDDGFYADFQKPLGMRQQGSNTAQASADDNLQRQIVMTTGSHHMQAYWYPMDEGHRFLGMLPYMYLKDEQRWIPRHSAFLHPPEPKHDETGRWSTTCIQCHATHGKMNVKQLAADNTFSLFDVDTRVAEFGIACEACHGPGQQHIAAHQSPVQSDQGDTKGQADDPDIVHPGRLTHERSSQVCGRCHGIFEGRDLQAAAEILRNGWDFRPGDDPTASGMMFLHRCSDGATEQEKADWKNYFWSDGMVRISGREYNGLVESPCYQHGDMSCLSCHKLHKSDSDDRPIDQWTDDQLDVGMRSNDACLQCHPQMKDEAALIQHTHHAADSTGSSCYNCHMSHTTYGLLKAIRSHTISSPTVQSTLETGRPNACNQCHLDQTLQWTADRLSQWYDTAVPTLTDEQKSVASSVIWSTKGDAGQRALMAWSFGWPAAQAASGTDWMAPFITLLMKDPYDAVRFISYRSMKTIPSLNQITREESLTYDFVAEETRRNAIANKLLKAWQTQSQSNPDKHSSTVSPDWIQKLLPHRDLRAVELRE